jgi:hypothetical protein
MGGTRDDMAKSLICSSYRSANKGAQFVLKGIPTEEDLTSNNYIDIAHEQFQHLFNFIFGVFVRGIRVVFNKVMILMTDQ